MRYLGVDYGSKKVGLALSDEAGTMGFPHAIVSNTPRLADELRAFIAHEHVGVVVIGESRTLAGGKNPIALAAHALGDTLAVTTGVPVVYESEIYTSAEARRPLEMSSAEASRDRVVRKSRAPVKHEHIDASAAALILTSYLSRTTHE